MRHGLTALQNGAQAPQPGADPRFESAHRQAQALGGLLVGEASEVGHFDGGPLVGRNPGERLAHGQQQITAVASRAFAAGELLPLELVEPGRFAGLAPEVHQLVARDRIEPTQRIAAVGLEAGGFAPDRDEHLLHDVLGQVGTAAELACIGEDAAGVELVERLKGLDVSTRDPVQQGGAVGASGFGGFGRMAQSQSCALPDVR